MGLADVGLDGAPHPPRAALKLMALDCLNGFVAAAWAGSAAIPDSPSAVHQADLLSNYSVIVGDRHQ